MTESTLGILGGGQLARMLAIAAAALDVAVIAIEPAVDANGRCPASGAGPHVEILPTAFNNLAALEVLARRCDVITVETENVPVDTLAWLAERVPTRPGAEAVAVTQDRLLEKRALRAAGIATAPFDEIDRGAHDLPAIVKTRRGGYDGKGQRLVRDRKQLDAALQELDSAIVEGIVPFDRELSIVAARGLDGSFAAYPLVENRHRDGILRRTDAPAPASDYLQREAETMAQSLMDSLGYVGVLAIEWFEVAGRLVANEVAPRVHNSGHWTIEGAETSQFEQHVRAVLGRPLGPVGLRCPSVMLNLIGSVPDPREIAAAQHAVWHSYGKTSRPGRKVGHITICHSNPTVLANEVAWCESLLSE